MTSDAELITIFEVGDEVVDGVVCRNSPSVLISGVGVESISGTQPVINVIK